MKKKIPMIRHVARPRALLKTRYSNCHSLHTGGLREGSPGTLAMAFDVADEALVFLLSPRTLVGVLLLTAGGPSHVVVPGKSCR